MGVMSFCSTLMSSESSLQYLGAFEEVSLVLVLHSEGCSRKPEKFRKSSRVQIVQTDVLGYSHRFAS